MKKYTMVAVVTIACLSAFSFALAGGREYKPVNIAPNVETGYIENIKQQDNHYVLSMDQIDWYEGDMANQKFIENEGDSGLDGPPDGYYIVNDYSEIESLPIADDAVVLMQIYNRTGNILEADFQWDEQISLEKFVEIMKTEDDLQLKSFPYHLTIENGVITRIVQQYVP